MKTYEEMAQSALSRGKAIRKQRKKNSKIIFGAVSGIVVCCLVIMLATGTKEPYTLKTVDGVHYIEVGSEYAPSKEDLKFNVAAPSLSFSTMDEMVDTVLNKKLDERQLKVVYRFLKDENGRIRTVDFTNLAVPVVPENHTLSSKVSWSGRSYGFNVKGENDVLGFVACMTTDKFEGLVSSSYKQIYENEKRTITKEEKVEDRNATVVYSSTTVADLKNIIYSFQQGDTQYTVFEQYTLRNDNPSSYIYIISDVIPERVDVYVRKGDLCVEFQIRYLSERPSMECIKQFNVTKYVPAEEKK